MSEAPDGGPPIRTPGQLIAAVIAGFAVPVVVIALLAYYVDNTTRTGAGTDELASAEVAKRIAPLARVTVQDTGASASTAAVPASDAASAAAAQNAQTQAAAAAIAAIGSAPQAAAPTGTADAAQVGKALYQRVCQTCHAAGVLGAPKFGNKADWAPRLKDPMETIYNYALHGKGQMPPKGGSGAPDADVKAAVDYMVGAAK